MDKIEIKNATIMLILFFFITTQFNELTKI